VTFRILGTGDQQRKCQIYWGFRIPAITKKAIDFASTPVAVAQRELLESIKSTPDFALRLGKTVWKNNEWILAHDRLKYSGPQNLDGMISYTWRLKTGGPSGKNEKELSAII